MTGNITVNENNSIRIATDQGVIYVDPFNLKEKAHDAAFILITHDHYDHFSPEDIKKAAGDDTVMVVPEKMAAKAEQVLDAVSRIETVSPGESREIGGLKLETVPAYNQMKPFHPKSAGWVGYIIISGGKRIYIAGDTDATKEAMGVKCDIAMVPIGGTFTMNAVKAAELINTIMPGTAIPVHYGSVAGKPSDGEVFRENVKEPVEVEFKIRF